MTRTGARIDIPLHYCLSQVNLRFRAEGATFCEPRIDGRGSFAGPDFELVEKEYAVRYLSATGEPRCPSESDEGLIEAVLPEGRYELTPRISSGGSSVELNPIELEVGCRQVYDVWSDLSLALDALPECLAAARLHVSGSVVGEVAIDRIEYRLNDAPSVVVCTACGIAPAFAFDAELLDGENTLVVTAFDTLGRAAEVLSLIERRPGPGSYGNTLKGVKEGAGARMRWISDPLALASQLAADGDKRAFDLEEVAVVPQPIAEALDPDALSAARGRILYYKVRGLDCGGIPGP